MSPITLFLISLFRKNPQVYGFRNGAGCGTLQKLLRLTGSQNYSHSWESQQHIDLDELRRQRLVDNLSIRQLASHFNCSKTAAECWLRVLRKLDHAR